MIVILHSLVNLKVAFCQIDLAFFVCFVGASLEHFGQILNSCNSELVNISVASGTMLEAGVNKQTIS